MCSFLWFFLVSFLINIALCIYLYRTKQSRPVSIEARDILKDLVRGGTLLSIRRIDPDEVYVRSPK